MLYLRRTVKPRITEVEPDFADGTYLFTRRSGLADCPQLRILRIRGSIYFGAAPYVQDALRDIAQEHVLIDAMGINFIDLAGARVLAEDAKRRRRLGGGLYLYRVNDEVKRILQKSGLLSDIGEANIFGATGNPIGSIYPQLNTSSCRKCEKRVFAECVTHLPSGEGRDDPRPGVPSSQVTSVPARPV
jgi:SulP family sulfate permease